MNEECGTNRDILILSLIVLLSIGVLKIFILAFSNRISEKSVRLKIVLEDKEYISEAFVDTGNLLKDPFDLSPVLLINKSFAERIFPKKLPNISSVSNINDSLKGCFRIIPIKTSTGSKALAGFKPDAVFVLKDKKSERINLTVAIDEEGGSYGGFDALISAAALDNIR